MAAFLLVLGFAGRAPAQSLEGAEFSWSSEVSVLAANALLGGVSGAVAAWLRGEPLVPSFGTGAGAGALVYAGKRLAVDDAPGAGLVGRQVASVGASVIGNAVQGQHSFDRIAFALGPVRLYVGREVPGVDWRLDVPAVAATAWGVFGRGADIDVGQSLSAGAVVLRDPHADVSLPGTIFHRHLRRPDRVSYVLAHEQVHVIQYDHSYLSWGRPIEQGLARRVPLLRGPLRYLEFNLPLLAGVAASALLLEHDYLPWEQEAAYLGRTR